MLTNIILAKQERYVPTCAQNENFHNVKPKEVQPLNVPENGTKAKRTVRRDFVLVKYGLREVVFVSRLKTPEALDVNNGFCVGNTELFEKLFNLYFSKICDGEGFLLFC